jgi:predicted MPP superfamily phosphohydrolase
VENIPDFTKRRNFPGTLDNEFDIVLRRFEMVEQIPSLLFAGLLFLIAIPPTYGHWGWTVGLWAFFLADWLLLALLPRFERSYGPAKPPALLLALMRMVFAFLPFPIAVALQGVGTLLVVSGFWIEPHQLSVTRQTLRSPKLQHGKPVRILHLGDLHVERITRRERRVNQLIQELRPDIILFSGDVINLSYLEDPVAWQAARALLAEWRAPGGTYMVTGSPAVDLEHMFPKLVEGFEHLTWLKEDCVSVPINGQTIDILGLTCSHKPFIDGPKLDGLVARCSPNGSRAGNFTILVYHTPDLAPNAANTGVIDLQVSGHTHGGQIRLPWFGAPFAASLYGKRFEAGRIQLGGMTLYVSRGIGLEGKAAPRVRFLCAPEIILWEIDGEIPEPQRTY